MKIKEMLSALARDHLEHPRNRAAFPADAPGTIVSGEAGSAAAGAFVRFYLRIAAGRIAAARYEVLGPPELMASASWYAERLTGLASAAPALPVGMDAARALDLPRPAHGFALLVEDAVRRCLRADC